MMLGASVNFKFPFSFRSRSVKKKFNKKNVDKKKYDYLNEYIMTIYTDKNYKKPQRKERKERVRSPIKTPKELMAEENFCVICKSIVIGRDISLNHFKQHADQQAMKNKTEADKVALEGVLKCRLCLEEFLDGEELKAHEENYHLNRKYLCPVCNRSFMHQYQYIHHMNSYGPTQTLYRCTDCDFQTTYYIGYCAHIKSHVPGPTTCKYCGHSYETTSQLRDHIEWKHKDGDAKYQCKLCSKEYPLYNSLKRHLRFVHFNEKRPKYGKNMTVCLICGKDFNEARLKAHLRLHDEVKPFACTYCDKKFPENRYLVEHLRTHTGERPYKCHICNRGFTQRTPLKVHLKKHNGETPFKCHICLTIFKTHMLWDKHMKEDLHDKSQLCDLLTEDVEQKKG